MWQRKNESFTLLLTPTQSHHRSHIQELELGMVAAECNNKIVSIDF